MTVGLENDRVCRWDAPIQVPQKESQVTDIPSKPLAASEEARPSEESKDVEDAGKADNSQNNHTKVSPFELTECQVHET